jgi:hypothetical protein
MATTTPNFGWAVPTSTDLVKDGAVAIETLGDAIDASLVDLKGGTTGQVLAKASGTDMDFSWVTDATGIPATILDAKGDIIAATAADTASRLAVGADGTVLTADSTAATGLKWAAAAGGLTYVGVSCYKNANQTVSTATFTAVTFQVEDFDTDAFHSTSTNTSRFTIPTGKGGKYLVSGVLAYSANVTGQRNTVVYKNGSVVNYGTANQAINSTVYGSYVPISFVLNLVAGDYVEIFAFQTSGGNLDVTYGGSGAEATASNIQLSYLGA